MLMMIIEHGYAALKPAMRLEWEQSYAEHKRRSIPLSLKAPAQSNRVGKATIAITCEASLGLEMPHE